MKFLIIGLGYAGARHKKNLEKLGHDCFVCLKSENLKAKIKEISPKAIIIATPTHLHIPQALIAASQNIHIFVEKPISNKLESIDKLLYLCKKNHLVLQVGYQMRFHPQIIKLKKQIDSGEIGRVFAARIEAGQFLPDWRPNKDYKKVYSSKIKFGGGVILDLSHEIDYACWLFGKVKKIKAIVKKTGFLDIETEDMAEILLEFENGPVCEIHLDYLQKKYRRSCEIIASCGNLYWEDTKDSQFDQNIPYIEELKNFIAGIKGKQKPLVNGYQAKEVLKIALNARKNL